jgi:hypothetical protein
MERGWVVLAGSIHGTAVSLWENPGRGGAPLSVLLFREEDVHKRASTSTYATSILSYNKGMEGRPRERSDTRVPVYTARDPKVRPHVNTHTCRVHLP